MQGERDPFLLSGSSIETWSDMVGDDGPPYRRPGDRLQGCLLSVNYTDVRSEVCPK